MSKVKDVISKELLSEVLGYQVCTSGYIKENDTSSVYWGMIGCRAIDDCEEYEEFMNIHELAHKCKIWVYEQGYTIGEDYRSVRISKLYSKHEVPAILWDIDYFKVDDSFIPFDPIYIIKATQWILENKNKHEN